ncbi:hypothetical protein GYMLUDRAFT_35812 [Collybiopsis luxurians FD-317 M1]|nr:hypothetical protein GYMLUDRAFT_35812 [Collybiopsis luxurians FD-317 M1]
MKRKLAKKPVSGAPIASESNVPTGESLVSHEDPPFFPFARYTSLVGVNSSLMVFVGLFFPRSTTLLNSDTYPAQRTSRDRPQHPFLDPLTASPVSTLAYICFGIMILQAWWGGWVRHWWIDQNLKGTKEDKKMQRRDLDGRKFAQYLKAWIFVLGTSIVLYAVLVFLGAPFLSCAPQTYLLALLLAILTIVPPAYTFGPISVSSETESLLIRLSWTRLFAEFQIRGPVERAMVYPAVGTIIGSWLGVIPIALDWDRPWQVWPLTPAYGALIGYITASMAALTVSGIKALADEHIRALNNNRQS